jgi:hypothetical protein
MPAGYQDIYLEQGVTYVNQLTLDDVTGSPYNLTGFTVRSQARKSYFSTNPTITFDATVYDANNGIIQLTANSAVTANVAAGKLVYDVVIVGSNTVTRVLEGQIFVSPAVTR